MAMENFERSLAAVLKHEGGKVDHPQDPGGRTNMGVTQRVYDGYRQRRKLAKRDVYQISMDEVRAIYRQQYWDVIKGDQLPPGIDFVVFDGAVNSGPSQSVKWLQRALNKPNVKVDGVIGNVTLAEIEKISNHDQLVTDICARRMEFLKALKTWPTFGKGWTNRVNAVRQTGHQWARGHIGPAVVYNATADMPMGKGMIEDAKPMLGTGVADASTGAGLGLGSLGVIIDQAKDQLLPMSAGSELIGRIVTFLIVASALLTVGGLVFRYIRGRREAARADSLDITEATTA